MSRIKHTTSRAKQRDAELTQVEADLKSAREQLEAINAEIRRSQMILIAIKEQPVDAGPTRGQFDGAMAAFPFSHLQDRGRILGEDESLT